MSITFDRKKVRKIVNVIIILLIIVAVVVPGFIFFRISTGSHTALRRAKNIKLSYTSVDIEYYGKNSSVYNPLMPGRMSEGVEDRIRHDLDEDAEFEITYYDAEHRKVTGMRYFDGDYLVEYKYKDGADHWTVDYVHNLIGR